MRPLKKVLNRIVELEVENDPEGEGYLNEGQQAELNTLYWMIEDEDVQPDLDTRIEEARENWLNNKRGVDYHLPSEAQWYQAAYYPYWR